MKITKLILASLALCNFSHAADVRTRDVYFCNEAVNPKALVGVKSAKDFVAKNSNTSSTTKIRTWNMHSHVLTVFAGGGLPTIISLDGANDLTPAAHSSIGKDIAGYAVYSMDTDSGLSDEWGMEAIFEAPLAASLKGSPDGKGAGKMILRSGSEENIAYDTTFACDANEGGAWNGIR